MDHIIYSETISLLGACNVSSNMGHVIVLRLDKISVGIFLDHASHRLTSKFTGAFFLCVECVILNLLGWVLYFCKEDFDLIY